MTSCRGDLRVSVPQIMSASFHAMLSEFAMRYSTRVPREVYAGFFPGADTFGIYTPTVLSGNTYWAAKNPGEIDPYVIGNPPEDDFSWAGAPSSP